MSKREKIIVITASIFVLFGIYYFYNLNSKKKQRFENIPDVLNIFMNDVNQDLISENLSESEAFIIKQIKAKWQDPFLSEQVEVVENKIEDFGPLPEYSGYLLMENQAIAVVDNREYVIGEKLEKSQYILMDIFPEYIKIKKPGRKIKKVPILKDEY